MTKDEIWQKNQRKFEEISRARQAKEREAQQAILDNRRKYEEELRNLQIFDLNQEYAKSVQAGDRKSQIQILLQLEALGVLLPPYGKP